MESIEADVIRLEKPGLYRRKELPTQRISNLPRASGSCLSFSEVLRRRRSADSFLPLTDAGLSNFLYDVASLQQLDVSDGNRQKRFVPSMGALHPAHLLIHRPEKGWFAYLPEIHALGLLAVDPDKALLSSLAQDLPAVWSSPTTEPRLKQRIVRILIKEIVVDVDEEKREIVLIIHWAGGRHSELRVPKLSAGWHGRCTSLDAVDVVRQMAGLFPDRQIATTLNRLGLRTGVGNTWTPVRVATLRCYHEWPAYSSIEQKPDVLTLEQAARVLGICPTTARKLVDLKILQGTQVVPCAPWWIPRESLETDAVRRAVASIKEPNRAPHARVGSDENLLFSTTQ
jgi:hypothetical protein